MKFKIIIAYTVTGHSHRSRSQTLKVTVVTQEGHCVDKCRASLTTSVSFLSSKSFPHFQGPSRIVHMWWQQRQYKHMLLASCILRTATNKKHIQNLATHKESKLFHGNYLFRITILGDHSPLKTNLVSNFSIFFSPTLGCGTVTCFRVRYQPYIHTVPPHGRWEYTYGRTYVQCSSVVNKELESHSIAAHEEYGHRDC